MSKIFLLTEKQAKKILENNFSLVSTSTNKRYNGENETSTSAKIVDGSSSKMSNPTTLDKQQKSQRKKSYINTVMGGGGLLYFGLW